MNVTSLLQDLIRLPSVNPMGRDLPGDICLESRVSDYLVEFFKSLDVQYERIEVAPGRANVIARFDSAGATRTIVLDAHQDTVPIDGMTIEPFDPVVGDGRIQGRGACDVKGGMAAMLSAFARLARERPEGASNVVMSCTCDEEQGQLGINDLTELWSDGKRRSKLLEAAPDVAIVAEPTELHVVVAHRGAARWMIRTTGRACHSSDPSRGENAIYKMARVLAGLEEYAGLLGERVTPHPLCGPATLSVGVISGGVSVNTVPDECLIEIDRRCVPGEDGQAAIDAVGQYLRETLDVDFEMLPPWCIGPTLADDDNGPIADELLGHVAAVAGSREKIGVPYGTHASRFAGSGVPSVVFGPGSIAQAHTKDEWVSIEQLHQAEEVYYRLCASPGRQTGS
jgi:acetylornithine deacetylase